MKFTILPLLILLVLWIPLEGAAETSPLFSSSELENIPFTPVENVYLKGIKTKYAHLYAAEEVEIPASLISNFDRIFLRVAGFFKVEVGTHKVPVFVVRYETLQQMYNYNREACILVAAFYNPNLDSIFLTSRYMDNYYIAHELIHYFMDRYEENVATSIGKLISQEMAE